MLFAIYVSLPPQANACSLRCASQCAGPVGSQPEDEHIFGRWRVLTFVDLAQALAADAIATGYI